MSASLNHLSRLTAGRWPEILRICAPKLVPAINRAPRHGPCPFDGGHDGFRFFDDYRETGGAVCNTCGSFPNGFRLLACHNDWSIEQVCQAVEAALTKLPQEGLADGQEDHAASPAFDQGRLDALQSVLDASIAPDEPAAEAARLYLAKRGLTLDQYPEALRFHPGLVYWEPGEPQITCPCLLSLIGTDEGVVGIHRTFLTATGEKAAVFSQKKLMPSPQRGWTKGGAVRLDEPNTALAVAEGVETALAVRQATGLPTWATVSAHGMEQLIVPGDVRDLGIWADKDRSRTGQQAAQRLANRLTATGCQVRIFLPPYAIPEGQKGIDWLDVLNMEDEG